MYSQFNPTATTTYSIPNGLQSLQLILQSASNSVFFCYFAVVDPTGFISSAVDPFAEKTIAWNLLYSLGYLYTDTYNIVDETTISKTYDYKVIGTSIGDMLMRPLYSHYLDRFT